LKQIDLRKRRDVNAKYIGVPQPMIVYHGTEEFRLSEIENSDKPTPPFVIHSLTEFVSFVQERQFVKKETYSVIEENIWIATGEKFIPDFVAPDGSIAYQRSDSFRLKPIDNCYIQLFVLVPTGLKYILFTSSGIFKVGISEWQLTGAIKQNFKQVTIGRLTQEQGGDIYYNFSLKRILEGKKTLVSDIRAMNLLINPLSDAFLNADAACKIAFPQLRKKDREKYINSERFAKLLIKELVKLMPDLQKSIHSVIPTDSVAVMLKSIAEWAIASDHVSVKDKLTAVEAIINTGGYSTPGNLIADKATSEIPLISNEAKKVEVLSAGYRSADLPLSMRGVAGDKPKPSINVYDDTDVYDLTVEERDAARKHVGSMPGYVDDSEEQE
jgi:hypothetical protein